MGYYGNVPKRGTKTRFTKTELIDMLNTEIEWAAERNQHLLEANNKYLERARTAEAEAESYADKAGERLRERDEFETRCNALADELDVLRGEREADITHNLEEQTWLRMQVAKVEHERDEWKGVATAANDEMLKWAKAFGELRRNYEREAVMINTWLDNVSVQSKFIVIIDFVLITLSLLTLAGVIPPVFRDVLPWL